VLKVTLELPVLKETLVRQVLRVLKEQSDLLDQPAFKVLKAM
jgi:hypothetical protein